MGKANAMRTLARVALLNGDPRGALALADSSLEFRKRAGRCHSFWDGPDAVIARARLSLGDHAGAENAFASAAPFGSAPYAHPDSVYTDSVRSALGSHFNATRWRAKVDSSHAADRACEDQQKAASDSAQAQRRARGQP